MSCCGWPFSIPTFGFTPPRQAVLMPASQLGTAYIELRLLSNDPVEQ